MELLHQLAPESLEARDKDGLSPAKCAEIPLEECGDPIQEGAGEKKRQGYDLVLARSPSSALSPLFWGGGGFPYFNRLQKKETAPLF